MPQQLGLSSGVPDGEAGNRLAWRRDAFDTARGAQAAETFAEGSYYQALLNYSDAILSGACDENSHGSRDPIAAIVEARLDDWNDFGGGNGRTHDPTYSQLADAGYQRFHAAYGTLNRAGKLYAGIKEPKELLAKATEQVSLAAAEILAKNKEFLTPEEFENRSAAIALAVIQFSENGSAAIKAQPAPHSRPRTKTRRH